MMIIIKIISFALLFLIALLPIIYSSDEIYKSAGTKIFSIILILFLLGANVIVLLLEKIDADKKDEQTKSLLSDISAQSIQLGKLRSENQGLMNQVNNLQAQLIDQRKMLKLNAELDNFINHFNVSIVFDKEYRFDEIHPTSFGYYFYMPFKEFSFAEVYVTDDHTKSKKYGLLLSYKIYDVKRGGNAVDGTQYGGFDHMVRGLDHKIMVLPDTYTIRSVQGGIFEILLVPDLIDKVIGVMFLIDDWVLIRQEVNPSMWEKVDDITRIIGWQKYGLDQKTFYRIKPEFTMHNKDNPWKIDLYKTPLRKLE